MRAKSALIPPRELVFGSLGARQWTGLILALALALAFEFVNGFHATANTVAIIVLLGSQPSPGRLGRAWILDFGISLAFGFWILNFRFPPRARFLLHQRLLMALPFVRDYVSSSQSA
jgi:hypothetical protein